MKAGIKLILFSVMLNLAVGIMSQAIPTIANDPTFNPLEYDANAVTIFIGEINGTINPAGDLEDKGSKFDRLLDSIGIGVVKRIAQAVDTYMFGFIQIIERIFGVDILWFSIFIRVLITIAYAFGIAWLWTGKNIGKG